MPKKQIAIDFGSSRTKVAWYDAKTNEPRLLELGHNIRTVIPSLFYLPPKGKGKVLVGDDALNVQALDPNGLVSDLRHELDQPGVKSCGSGRVSVNRVELVAELFKYIKETCEQTYFKGDTVDSCVLTVPGYFKKARCEAIKKAAETAGFEKIKLIKEAQAVATLVGYEHAKTNRPIPEHLIICDIGGESSDFTLVKHSEQGYEVIETSFLNRLPIGGNDLDQMIWKKLLTEWVIADKNEELIKNTEDVLHQISLIKEFMPEGDMESLPLTINGKDIEIPITFFQAAIAQFTEKVQERLKQFIADCSKELGLENLPVLLAGGTSNLNGLKSCIDQISPGQVYLWNKSEYATVLGATVPVKGEELEDGSGIQGVLVKPGIKFGQYDILKCLGHGGMGEVWLAWHPTMDQHVAIKILHRHLTQKPEFVDRFMAEIKNTAKLKHVNIVRAHDAGVQDGIYYMVSDYVDGMELAVKLKQEKIMSELEALDAIEKVAVALEYAWDKFKILHRDIKPDNIMIDKEGHFLLMDMGIAKSMHESAVELTSADAILGTPHYMSPEQIQSTDLDFKADMYSLGATLYHIATGTKPFDGDSVVSVATKQLMDPLPDPHSRNPNLSPSCASLIKKMMAKNPDDRFNNWHEVIQIIRLIRAGKEADIENPQQNTETVSTEAEIAARVEEETETKKLKIITTTAAACLAFIIALVFAFIVFSSDDIPYTVKLAQKNATLTLYSNEAIVEGFNELKLTGEAIDIPKGTYKFEVKKPGFKPAIKDKVEVTEESNILEVFLTEIKGKFILKTAPGTRALFEIDGKEIAVGKADKKGNLAGSFRIGTHNLILKKQGYLDRKQKVTIAQNDISHIGLLPLPPLPGKLLIKSLEGYEVFEGRALLGSVGKVISDISAGEHFLTLKKDKYESKTIHVVIASDKKTEISAPLLAKAVGSILITPVFQNATMSDSLFPKQGKVQVNQEPWETVSFPYTVKNLSSIPHTIKLKFDNFETTEPAYQATVKINGLRKVKAKIIPKKINITITSTQKGAEVYRGSTKLANCGEKLSLRPFTIHKLSIKSKGFATAQMIVNLKSRQEINFKAPKLSSSCGHIQVILQMAKKFTLPIGMKLKGKLKLDNESWRVVEFPCMLEDLSCSPHKIAVKLDGFTLTRSTKSATVKNKSTEPVTFQITPKSVRVQLNGPRADIKIYKNGKLLGLSGVKVDLQPFIAHQLEMRAKGYHTVKYPLTITSSATGIVDIPGKLERVGKIIISATIVEGSRGPKTPPTEAMMRLDNNKEWQKIKLPFHADLICKSHKIQLKVPFYTSSNTRGNQYLRVTATPDKTTHAIFNLRPSKVRYTLTANAKKAKIYRKGKWIGRVGRPLLLAPYVKHKLKLKAKGFVPYSLTLTINDPSKSRSQEVIMTKAKIPETGKTWVVDELGLKMIPIKSGSFTMGSDHPDDESNQRPAREVKLTHNFWIGETEVTQHQYKMLMGTNPSKFKESGPEAPVEQVSWGQAVAFCNKLTELEINNGRLDKGDYYRLPTEAEWEYCCRAGSQGFFNTGDNLTSDQANVDGRYSYDGHSRGIFRRRTIAVASFSSNAWGLYDMHGNVKEWTRDISSSDYSSSKSVNPLGAPVGFRKSVRGGSWRDYPKNSKSTYRYDREPRPGSSEIGFRVVLVIIN